MPNNKYKIIIKYSFCFDFCLMKRKIIVSFVTRNQEATFKCGNIFIIRYMDNRSKLSKS